MKIKNIPGTDIQAIHVGGVQLIERSKFIELLENLNLGTKHTVNRLVNEGKLQPYKRNFQPKKRKNGSYPAGVTLYDFKEFQSEL